MQNFFEQQQQAKRNTLLLLALFSLAIILILALVAALTAIVGGVISTPAEGQYQVRWQPLALICAGVTVAIGLVMFVKWLQLKNGGKVVAESLGGVLLSPDSQDPLERRILNVVEEMAIAANMAVPSVYLLPNEANINAFAAGFSTHDAVIGLTRGAVEAFSREQLQAVVAHEFSHILNGDMRLNMRLISALAGILAFAHLGRILLHSARFSGRGRNRNNALPLIGLGLMVVGGIGVFFGSLIKAAVSRQREYLADAAAVQFTRNPRALSGALQQIGARQLGSRIAHQNADQAEHLFFAQSLSKWFSMMATHPPLEKRIKRVEPSWNGRYPAPQTAQVEAEQQPGDTQNGSNSAPFDRLLQLAIPVALLEQVRSPEQAPKVIRQLLVEQLVNDADAAVSALKQLNPAQQLALIELAMPALRSCPYSQRLALIQDIERLEQSQDLFHWCLFQLLARQLLPAKRFQQKLSVPRATAVTIAALEQAERGEKFARAELEQALNTIVDVSPTTKQGLVSSWLATIKADEHISLTEKKLVATLCACIEVPLPDEMLEI